MEIHKTRSKYSRKIFDLPEDTNEVLLWRQVRHTGAKALHIFKNTNSNNKRSATVLFSSEADCSNSSKFTIRYYNNKLKWATIRANKYVGNETHTENTKISRVLQEKSSKSLGKMKEIEQDQGEGCSKYVHKEV